jgi:ribulose-5-phosphate 4-epimerase/fuculose-1-phosphate aldolase
MELMDHPEAREALVDAGRRLLARGLVTGTSGNLSVRVGDEAHRLGNPRVLIAGELADVATALVRRV